MTDDAKIIPGGFFVAFEGSDGAGKTTQAQAARKMMRRSEQWLDEMSVPPETMAQIWMDGPNLKPIVTSLGLPPEEFAAAHQGDDDSSGDPPEPFKANRGEVDD